MNSAPESVHGPCSEAMLDKSNNVPFLSFVHRIQNLLTTLALAAMYQRAL